MSIDKPVVTFVAATIVSVLGFVPHDANAADSRVERGTYLVAIMDCNGCHTPGALLGKKDMSRALGGAEVGFELPGLGAFYPPNLTPDKETGIGTWTRAQIVAAFATGTTPEGRKLAPIMPWETYSHITKEDADALAAYLETLPAAKNKVPGPFGPNEMPTSFVMKMVPPPQH